jgi:predicted membrane protein
MKFEGEVVDGGNTIVIRQFRGDIDVPLALDEVVELNVVCRVSEVAHTVSQKSGLVTRTHIVHVKEVTS